MSLDELLQELLRRLRNPQQLIVYAWFAWWVWSTVRARLRRNQQAESGSESGSESESESESESGSGSESESESAAERERERARERERERAREQAGERERAREQERERGKEREREEGVWGRAVERAEGLRRRAEGERGLRRFEPIIVEGVRDPLLAAQRQAGRGKVEPEVSARGRRAIATLGVLERVFRERARDEEGARRLGELDRIAEACHAPLREYAQAEGLVLHGLYPVASRSQLAQTVGGIEDGDELLVLPVGPGFGAHLHDYVGALHDLGRRWYSALPELAEELESELGVAPRVRLLGARSEYDAASVHAYFGPWLPGLFAEVALSLRLGSGYVSGLRKSLATDAHPTRARADGALLHGTPPALLRMRAALAALEALGQQDEVERHAKAFAAEHEGLERSYLPLADGRALVVDSSYLLDFTDVVAKVVLDGARESLGGVPLSGVPGLSQSLEERREQRQLAQALAGKRLPERPNPVQLLCGALLAWDTGADPRLVIEQLQQALSPLAARKTEAAPHTIRRAPTPRTLRAAARDRRTLRAAIELGAAFERPRSEVRRWR